MYLFHLSYSDPQAESHRAWSSFNSGVCSPPGGTAALQKQQAPTAFRGDHRL